MLEGHCRESHSDQRTPDMSQFVLKCRLCKVNYGYPDDAQKWADHCARDHRPKVPKLTREEVLRRTCSYCPEAGLFTDTQDLLQHKNQKHKESQFRCRWCPGE